MAELAIRGCVRPILSKPPMRRICPRLRKKSDCAAGVSSATLLILSEFRLYINLSDE